MQIFVLEKQMQEWIWFYGLGFSFYLETTYYVYFKYHLYAEWVILILVGKVSRLVMNCIVKHSIFEIGEIALIQLIIFDESKKHKLIYKKFYDPILVNKNK